MIVLTRKCIYALRDLYFPAREYGNGLILTRRISGQANVPCEIPGGESRESRSRWRRNERGRYRLMVGSIIRIIDGPLVTLPCLTKNITRCEDCHDVHTCQTRLFMQAVQQAAEVILDQTTFLSASRTDAP
jgi:hypothetical protein